MRTHYTTGSEFAARRLGLEKTAADPLLLSLLGAALGGGATALSMPGIRKSVEASLKAMGKPSSGSPLSRRALLVRPVNWPPPYEKKASAPNAPGSQLWVLEVRVRRPWGVLLPQN
jgi:hypothetical protein